MRYRNNGFTLIEIMITVAILAIISAIAYPMYTGYISTSYNVEGMNNLHAIEIAQEEYFHDNNTYFSGATAAAINTASGGLWARQPASGYNFNYAVVGTATGFTATATGTNKVPSSVVLTVTK